MLCTRIIPLVLYDGQMAVKTTGFGQPRNVGSVVNVARLYNARQVDELVLLDVAATRASRGPDLKLIESFDLFSPFAVGGGIKTLADAKAVLRNGADKVVIGSGARDCAGLIESIAGALGCQAAIVCVDVVRREAGGWSLYDYVAARPSVLDAVEWAAHVAESGAGELLLQSVDRDGTRQGYDLELIEAVSRAVTVPVIAAGGAGQPQHCVDAVRAGANAVAAASMFHFTQYRPADVAETLRAAGIAARAA